MGLILKLEEIVSFLKEKAVFDGTEKIIWTNISSAQGAYVVVVFNKSGILTLPITPMGKIEGDIIIIPQEEIQSVTFKKGLLAYKMVVTTKDNEVPDFRVNKTMIGYGAQRKELGSLLEKYK